MTKPESVKLSNWQGETPCSWGLCFLVMVSSHVPKQSTTRLPEPRGCESHRSGGGTGLDHAATGRGDDSCLATVLPSYYFSAHRPRELLSEESRWLVGELGLWSATPRMRAKGSSPPGITPIQVEYQAGDCVSSVFRCPTSNVLLVPSVMSRTPCRGWIHLPDPNGRSRNWTASETPAARSSERSRLPASEAIDGNRWPRTAVAGRDRAESSPPSPSHFRLRHPVADWSRRSSRRETCRSVRDTHEGQCRFASGGFAFACGGRLRSVAMRGAVVVGLTGMMLMVSVVSCLYPWWPLT